MLAKVMSGTTIGLDGVLINVEVDVASRGFPTFTIVGLPSKAVDEAKERVRAAIVNTSFEMPDSRITVNLAPADIPKEGSGFDLPMAIAILAAAGIIDREKIKKSLFIGELSLEGNIRKTPGIISLAIMAKNRQIDNFYLPCDNVKEAALIDGVNIFPVRTLAELVLHLNGQLQLQPFTGFNLDEDRDVTRFEIDFEDIRGQEQAKRALEIAAAGFHNVHFSGPPGTGKTLLSRAFPSILPPLEKKEIIDVSMIYSICGLLGKETFVKRRPFRTPHHTISRIGLIGGGSHPVPGEISLAHRGVLFLDEFNEFPRSVLEALRQPLEDGQVTVTRAAGSLTFPARFLLLAASNPCPCGYLGHPSKRCSCLPGAVLRYRKKLSGPLLDRIDLHVIVPPVAEEKLTVADSRTEASENIRTRIVNARQRQKKRLENFPVQTNGEMSSVQVRKLCQMSTEAETILKQAIVKLSLSARVYFKTIKIARTIADLENSEGIEIKHVAESLQYRTKEE